MSEFCSLDVTKQYIPLAYTDAILIHALLRKTAKITGQFFYRLTNLTLPNDTID